MPVIRQKWAGFRGINRLVSRTALPPGDLYEAQGVVPVERGRMRPIWEGEAAAKYGGRGLTFPALTATAGLDHAAPESLELFRAVGRAAAASWHAGGFDGVTAHFYQTGTQQTYSGVSITQGDEELTLTISAAVPWMSRVQITDDNGDVHEHTAMSAHPYTTPSSARIDLDRPFTGGTSSSATVKIDMGGRCWLVDLGDWLVVCPERQPARAVHKSQVDETTITQFSTAAGDAAWVELDHVPIWLCTRWYAPGTATLSWSSPDFTDGSALFRTAGASLHEYGATMPTTWNAYAVPAVLYGRALEKDPENALTLGFRAEPASDTTLDLTPSGTSPVVYNATASVPYRIGYPATGMRYRFPVQYKGRFCAVDGRLLERVSGYNAGAGVTATINTTVATDPVAVAADITDSVRDGDWLVIYSTDAVHANVDFDETGTYAARVKYVRYSGGTTYLYLDVETNAFSGAPGTSVLFHVFRPLTAEQRRRVWFTGRPADSANGIARNERDFLWLDGNNNVIVGDDTDGDITALIAQGDDRLIVGLEAGVFEILGDPPIDGVAPGNFAVRRIASGVGIYRDTAAAWDDSGQVLYFCSGSDFGIHRLAGSAVDPERVDAEIWDHPQHPRHRGTGFSYLVVSDRRLWALTDEAAPVLWCLDLQTGGWTWTDRANSASGQTGANPAVDPSDPSYTGTPNYLYESGNHGGIFAPFRRSPGDADAALVVYRDTDYKLRTLAAAPDEHTNGALLHGVKLQTGHVAADGPIRVKAGRVTITKPITTDGSTALDGLIVTATNGEGGTTWCRTVDVADYEDQSGDSALYYAGGATGRGDESVSITVGDGVAPAGEVADIGADLIPTKRRRR